MHGFNGHCPKSNRNTEKRNGVKVKEGLIAQPTFRLAPEVGKNLPAGERGFARGEGAF